MPFPGGPGLHMRSRRSDAPPPSLGVGELEEVACTQLGHRRVRARARYRDATGTTRQIEATGTSRSAAKRALEQRL
ncbi:UNVERIFIED_CONTAM: hypothetical protein RF653_02135 [Kocuria sp. CPCC 205316]|uniref:hypothetical protein n=1 Tax=Kocuria TaxID=57493 RepID=UPI0036D8AB04